MWTVGFEHLLSGIWAVNAVPSVSSCDDNVPHSVCRANETNDVDHSGVTQRRHQDWQLKDSAKDESPRPADYRSFFWR